MERPQEHARQAVLDRLESLQRAGVLQLPKSRVEGVAKSPASRVVSGPDGGEVVAAKVAEGGDESRGRGRPGAAAGLTTLFDVAPAPARVADVVSSLEVLRQEVAGCTRCAELARPRNKTVFGVGNPASRLWFLGEAPGADEDKQGEPFVGRAGQLLNKIIEACRMKREDVYILNMIKCRPPENRNPLPQELSNCRGYLEMQFDLMRPEFICCLGAVAAQNLLGTTIGIGKLRGKIHAYRGAKVVCTYHPAFLLRSPGFKKETWEDMKMLMRLMGVELG